MKRTGAIRTTALVVGLALVVAAAITLSIIWRPGTTPAGPSSPPSSPATPTPSSSPSVTPSSTTSPTPLSKPAEVAAVVAEVPGLTREPSTGWTMKATAGEIFAIDDEHAVVVGQDGESDEMNVTLVTVADGKAVWKTRVNASSFQARVRALAGTNLLVVHSDSELYLVDRATGKVTEEFTTRINSWYGSSADGQIWYLSQADNEQFPQLSKLNSHDPADAAWTVRTTVGPSMTRDALVSVRGGYAFLVESVPTNYFESATDTRDEGNEAIGVFALADGDVPTWGMGARLALFDDYLVANQQRGQLTALDFQGKQLWQKRVPGASIANVNGALVEWTIVQISRLEPTTGLAYWTQKVGEVKQVVPLGQDLASISYADAGNEVKSSTVTVLDPVTGKAKASTGLTTMTYPVVWRGDGQLLISSRANEAEELRALTPDGKLAWTYTTDGEERLSQACGHLFLVSMGRVTLLK